MIFFYTILFIIACSFINRHRGGGPPRIDNYIDDTIGISFRSLFSATVFQFVILYFFSQNFIENPLIYSFGTSITWLLWGLNGWGSYFDIGETKDGYKDEIEITWIDWILFFIFGPKYIPKNDKKTKERHIEWSWKNIDFLFPVSMGFSPPDVKKSQSGKIRSYKWRKKRDITGFFFRHFHSFYFFLFQSWYFENYWILTLTIPFSIIITLSYIIVTTKWFPDLNIDIFKNNKYLRFNPDEGGYAELLSGIIFGIIMLLLLII